MSYEATIKLNDWKQFNVSAEPKNGVWISFTTMNASSHSFIPPAVARELAAALLDAAGDLDPVDLADAPVTRVAA